MTDIKLHTNLKARGKGAKTWANAFTEIEYLGNDKFTASIGSANMVFRDKTDGQWKKHKLTDKRSTDDYIVLQSANCCVEIYPYYARFFDVNHEEVRLHEERWVVQRLFKEPDTWRDVGAWSPVMDVEEGADFIKVTITYDTDYGTLTVEYLQRDGRALKHSVYFTNTSSEDEVFRVQQKWAGIVADKVKHDNGEESIASDTAIGGSQFRFIKNDGSLSIHEDQSKMYYGELDEVLSEQNLKPVTIGVHAQGLKADFIFGNWTLKQGERLEIDPDTTTINVGGDSYGSSSVPTQEHSGIYMRLDISGLDPDITVTEALLKIYISAIGALSDNDMTYFRITNQACDPESDNISTLEAYGTSNQLNWTGLSTGWLSKDITTAFNVDHPANTYHIVKLQDPDYTTGSTLRADGNPMNIGFYDLTGAPDDYRIRIQDRTSGTVPNIFVTYTPGVALPTVTTQAATDIEDTTATGNGNITNTGGENCDIRGIVWDLASHGNPGDVSPAVSDYDNDVAEGGSFGTGAFTRSLTGLPTGDTIYARAYAHNSEGYAYGGEVSFLTKPAAPTNVSATDGDHTDKVVITWDPSDGATGYKVYEGANLLDTLGDVATYDDTAAAAPTITPGTASASDGASPLHVTLSLAGESTTVGASRTYKVVALNATGDSDDSDTDTGYRGVGALTYQWQVENGGWNNIGGATTDPYNNTAAAAPTITPGTATASDGTSSSIVTLSLAGESTSVGATENYRCVLSATGAANATSTEDTGYRSVGAITYQWQRSAADSDAAFGNIGGATTDPYNDVGGVYFPDGRYYLCLLDATGAAQAESTHDRGYEDSIIDKIGAVLIQRINGFTRQGRRLTIIGDMDTETNMQTLEALCEDADVGSTLHGIPGGQTTGEDLTDADDFTVNCSFEDPSVPDGVYLILGPVRRGEDAVAFLNFSLDLFLL